MNRNKPHIKVVILGDFDSGKTTLVGHLIYKCGVIDKRIFDQLEKKAMEMGKHSFKYAWICDQLKGERERGVNVDILSWQFETNKNCITLMDGPGNRDFIKCMSTSILFAHCALLLMSARLGEFEASISKYSTTRTQILLASAMGIEHMIVLVNKMDVTDPPYSEDRFNEIKTEVRFVLKRIRYQPQNIFFIPITALLGDNLIEPADSMSWFKGQENTLTCKTLLEALDNIVLPPKPIDKPLRLILRAMYKTEDNETMFSGYVETGVLKAGMIVRFAPSNSTAQIKSIQMHYEIFEEALPGDEIVFTVDDVNKQGLRRGSIVSDAKNDPAQEISSFIAQIIILYDPDRIVKGFRCVIHCHLSEFTCEFVELLEKIDRKSGETIEKNPAFLKSNDTALVKIIPLKPMCAEKYSDYPSLGRFVIFDRQWVIAVGTIKHIEKKNLSSITSTNKK